MRTPDLVRAARASVTSRLSRVFTCEVSRDRDSRFAHSKTSVVHSRRRRIRKAFHIRPFHSTERQELEHNRARREHTPVPDSRPEVDSNDSCGEPFVAGRQFEEPHTQAGSRLEQERSRVEAEDRRVRSGSRQVLACSTKQVRSSLQQLDKTGPRRLGQRS